MCVVAFRCGSSEAKGSPHGTFFTTVPSYHLTTPTDKGVSNPLNIWIHLRLNIHKDSPPQNYQFLYPLAI